MKSHNFVRSCALLLNCTLSQEIKSKSSFLSNKTLHRPGPTFPPEISIHIIDYLHDCRTSLLKCSLVCRVLRDYSDSLEMVGGREREVYYPLCVSASIYGCGCIITI